ncbi:restriction endonuclease [Vibrio sp. 10N.261.51.F11]|uniref:restriction endonuclease n=1 Tax=Vibrio sp. 10N.261.51.F11 TaxID=3229678 RepID=UPI00354CF795
MVIDFTEIRDDHAFENFCMHLMEIMGLKIAVRPAKGPDGGRDIISEEPNRFTAMGYRYLVSCKHYAGSRRSVGNSHDEANANKLVEHGCNGFMFFFSTAYTENFKTSVEKVCNQKRCSYRIFNCYDIENILLSSPYYYPLIKQYFPRSHNQLVELKNTEPCCPDIGDDEPLYALYTSDEYGNVSYEVLGQCCISHCVDDLERQRVPYGVSQLRSAQTW